MNSLHVITGLNDGGAERHIDIKHSTAVDRVAD
jgi:hypothetical protein